MIIKRKTKALNSGYMGRLNKKGSSAEAIFLMVIAGFIFAVISIVGFYIASDNLVPEVRPHIESSEVANATLSTYDDAMVTLDYATFGIFMGLMLAVIVTALLIRVHPVFLFVFALMLILAIIVAVPLSNGYQTIEANLGTASDFTITSFVMGNLPLFTAVAGIIALIISFVKMQSGGSQGL